MFVYKFTAKVRFAHSAGRSGKSEAKTTKKKSTAEYSWFSPIPPVCHYYWVPDFPAVSSDNTYEMTNTELDGNGQSTNTK